MHTSARMKAVRRLLKDFPDIDLPAALGLATKAVSRNDFWVTNRYGFDNLLAKDNWVKYWEAARDQQARRPDTRSDGTLDLGGLDE